MSHQGEVRCACSLCTCGSHRSKCRLYRLDGQGSYKDDFPGHTGVHCSHSVHPDREPMQRLPFRGESAYSKDFQAPPADALAKRVAKPQDLIGSPYKFRGQGNHTKDFAPPPKDAYPEHGQNRPHSTIMKSSPLDSRTAYKDEFSPPKKSDYPQRAGPPREVLGTAGPGVYETSHSRDFIAPPKGFTPEKSYKPMLNIAEPEIAFKGSSSYRDDFPWRDVPVHHAPGCAAQTLPNPPPGVTGHQYFIKNGGHWDPLPSPHK